MRGLYYASGPAIRKCSIKEIKARSGNMVRMYELPLDDLEPLEFKEDLAEYAKSLFNN